MVMYFSWGKLEKVCILFSPEKGLNFPCVSKDGKSSGFDYGRQGQRLCDLTLSLIPWLGLTTVNKPDTTVWLDSLSHPLTHFPCGLVVGVEVIVDLWLLLVGGASRLPSVLPVMTTRGAEKRHSLHPSIVGLTGTRGDPIHCLVQTHWHCTETCTWNPWLDLCGVVLGMGGGHHD